MTVKRTEDGSMRLKLGLVEYAIITVILGGASAWGYRMLEKVDNLGERVARIEGAMDAHGK